jgi:peptidoglycan/xylan/chitin deacetylase (PgdA/CDA1 family)
MRSLAVAIGVPAAFALASGLLAVGSPGATATAAEKAADQPAADRPVAAGPDTGKPIAATPTSSSARWYVTRQLVRPTVAPVPVTFRERAAGGVVFITIDDGVHKDRRALRLVQRWRLPVTAFLSTWTIKDRAPYFRAITQWGSIQNHSSTHASLARSTTDLEHEVCDAQQTLLRDFGREPWLMRPPYGAGADRMEVQVTAARCGIARIVMWNAVVDKGRLSVPGSRLRPGDIVLLHFTPELARDLTVAVKAAHRAGLRPASLAEYLPDAGSDPSVPSSADPGLG